jgi:hypothetical protein
MRTALRLVVSAFAMTVLACASAAMAQSTAEPKPKQEEGVQAPLMRPYQEPDAPVATPPAPVVPIPRSDFPDSAPRIGGLSEQARGGAQCRTDCARRYYRCLAQDEMASCSPAWTQCQVGCPKVSSSE